MTKSAAKVKKRKGFLFSLLPSPRGDQCEQSAPTVRLQLSHGYRFKTPPRRLGFTAVPCRAMANLAVGAGCASVCEHSEIRFILIVPSAQAFDSRPPCIYSGRAYNACTNLLGYFVRYVRTRGMAETVGSGKTADFCPVLCRTHLTRMARATNSCTRGMNQCTQCVGWRRRDRGRVLKERGTLSLMTFGTFGHAKVR